jgi:putative transposase
MPARKYSVEQIVAKLRAMERLQGEGLSIPTAAKRLGISDQTFYRWRLKYGALKEDEAQRLKALEQENSRLKKDRRRAGPRDLAAEGPPTGKMVSPARRREAVGYLIRRRGISERLACRVVGQHRSTQRYHALVPAEELRLVSRINELAELHPRYGYRRVCALLRTEGGG